MKHRWHPVYVLFMLLMLLLLAGGIVVFVQAVNTPSMPQSVFALLAQEGWHG